MNLDQHKYAIIKLRVDKPLPVTIHSRVELKMFAVMAQAVDFRTTARSDFFVIKLRDAFAAPALEAYANAAQSHDPEYAEAVRNLAKIASVHPDKHFPD